ncbi:unnamed protein product [Paramecium octaurelia]|uniref:IBR domain-containing protein n=1 Tax=Paramecium octaurelia TaxID=43137 RepID=A0A8S1TLX7_PAROT|nr:unnamed protein product [Paramecium octaurelia]
MISLVKLIKSINLHIKVLQNYFILGYLIFQEHINIQEASNQAFQRIRYQQGKHINRFECINSTILRFLYIVILKERRLRIALICQILIVIIKKTQNQLESIASPLQNFIRMIHAYCASQVLHGLLGSNDRNLIIKLYTDCENFRISIFRKITSFVLEQNQSYKEILVRGCWIMIKILLGVQLQMKYYLQGFQCQYIYKLEQFSQKQKCLCGLSFVQIVRRIIINPQLAIFVMKSHSLKKQINLGYHQISACPNCKRYIQKIQDCMQISCVYGNDFCVNCSLPWNPDHGQDFYNCPFAAHNKNPSQIMIQMCLNEAAISRIIFE